MTDYPKMYAILCGAIDGVIEPLKKIPLALPFAAKLQAALALAEEVYIQTSPEEKEK